MKHGAQAILFSIVLVIVFVSGCVSTPTNTKPAVEAYDQVLVGDSVKVQSIISDGPGWMTIHIDTNGGPGEVIGYAHVPNGLSENVMVKIDVAKRTPYLYAMLHTDKGQAGVYEFPGPDVPVMDGNNIVMKKFALNEPGDAYDSPDNSGM
jgi:hypothetical protein